MDIVDYQIFINLPVIKKVKKEAHKKVLFDLFKYNIR